MKHGQRYALTFRKGLPAEDGETLIKAVTITAYVRDRSPAVRFPGRAYVLPRTGTAAVPVETVNVKHLDLTLRHVSDRNLIRAIQDDYFGKPLSEYQQEAFQSRSGRGGLDGTAEVQP